MADIIATLTTSDGDVLVPNQAIQATYTPNNTDKSIEDRLAELGI